MTTQVPERIVRDRRSDPSDWTFGGTWPYEPKWLVTGGARIHYVDEGPRDGEPVVMLHGNPTWSYLYRRFIAALTEAGFRAVAHDELGFGRSDKPSGARAYSLQRHVEHFAALMEELDLDDVTLVVQDWGGPIALTWAIDNPDRVRRLVVLNTWPGAVPPDHPKPSALYGLLRLPLVGELLAKGAHVFVRQLLLRGGTHPERLGADERAAYLAPHRTWGSRAGVLAYARLVPWEAGHITAPLGARIEAELDRLRGKPVLIVWALADPAFKERSLAFWRARFPQAEVHEIQDAGHYVQEDAPEQVIPLLLAFLRRAS
jgi:pimeloyl-ACP methyl ester carboxylesterase